MNLGKRDDGSYYVSTDDLRSRMQTATARKSGSSGIVKGLGLFGPTPLAIAAGAFSLGTSGAINRDVNELYSREMEGMLPPDDKEPGFLDKVGNSIKNTPRDLMLEINALPQTLEEEIIDPIVDTFSKLTNTIGLGSKTAPNINLTPKAKAKTKTKTLSKVSKENPFNINRVRVSTQPLALRTAKEAAQTVTLAQKAKANRDIAVGNYTSSGSDDGSFDSGVDDSGQATGQDQYD